MKNQPKNSQGVSLYLAILIIGTLLAMGLGLSSVLIFQLKLVRGMEESVMAFYAADSGIEQALYRIRKSVPANYTDFCDCLDLNEGGCSLSGSCPGTLADEGDSRYNVVITTSESETTIQSFGIYRRTQRAIEVKF